MEPKRVDEYPEYHEAKALARRLQEREGADREQLFLMALMTAACAHADEVEPDVPLGGAQWCNEAMGRTHPGEVRDVLKRWCESPEAYRERPVQVVEALAPEARAISQLLPDDFKELDYDGQEAAMRAARNSHRNRVN